MELLVDAMKMVQAEGISSVGIVARAGGAK
jgi:hypothetical protein